MVLARTTLHDGLSEACPAFPGWLMAIDVLSAKVQAKVCSFFFTNCAVNDFLDVLFRESELKLEIFRVASARRALDHVLNLPLTRDRPIEP